MVYQRSRRGKGEKLIKTAKKLIVFALITVVCITTVAGCKKDDNLNNVVLTMNDTKFTLQDLMYCIYLIESSGDQNEQFYQSYFGISYWDEEEDGVTYRELAKNDVIDMAKWYEVIYQKAVAEGYVITEEEIAQCESDAEDMLTDIEDAKEKKLGFTKEYLLENLEKETIVLRYQNDQIATYDLDEDAIKAEVSYEEYKQYEIDYIYGATQELDEEGNSIAYTDEQIAAVRSKIDTVMEKAKAGETFETLVSEEDEDLVYGATGLFYEDEEWDAKILAAAKTLKNGELYQKVIEAQDGFYLVKMINAESTQAYDEAVEEAVTTAQEEKFNTEYEKMLEGYKITVNEDEWKDIELGEITITPIQMDASQTEDSEMELETDVVE